MGPPVATDARAAALMLLVSFAVIGSPLTPISPMTPALTSVPPTPSVTSRTISSVSSSTVR